MEPSNSGGSLRVDSLLERCQNLLDELASFRCFLEKEKEQGPKSKYEHAVDLKQFHSMVTTEMKSLGKVRFIS